MPFSIAPISPSSELVIAIVYMITRIAIRGTYMPVDLSVYLQCAFEDAI